MQDSDFAGVIADPMNPYEAVGKPAQPEHFVGRLEALRHLLRVLPSIVGITGPEYIGRTSLLRFLNDPRAYDRWQRTVPNPTAARQVVAQLRQWRFFYLDLRRFLTTNDTQERSYEFLRALDRALRQFLHEPGIDGDTPATTEGTFDLVRRIRRNLSTGPLAEQQVCLLLDSADLLMRNSPACQRNPEHWLGNTSIPTTVALLVETAPNFGVVLAATQSAIDQRELSSISPVWARMVPMRLGPLTAEEARVLVALTPDDAPAWQRFSPEEQDWLLEQAGTHPYLLQGLCYLMFEAHHDHREATGQWEPLTDAEREEVLHMAHHTFDSICLRIGKEIAQRIWPKEPEVDLLHKLARTLIAHHNMATEYDLRDALKGYGLLVPYQSRPCELFVASVSRNAEFSRAAAPTVAPPPPPAVAAGRIRVRMPDGAWRVVRLSPLEYRLLAALKRAGSAEVSREALMTAGWGQPVSLSTFSQRLHQLRRKLHDVLGADCIENTYGSGYRLEDSQERIMVE
jgi:hypothetical protein